MAANASAAVRPPRAFWNFASSVSGISGVGLGAGFEEVFDLRCAAAEPLAGEEALRAGEEVFPVCPVLPAGFLVCDQAADTMVMIIKNSDKPLFINH